MARLRGREWTCLPGKTSDMAELLLALEGRKGRLSKREGLGGALSLEVMQGCVTRAKALKGGREGDDLSLWNPETPLSLPVQVPHLGKGSCLDMVVCLCREQEREESAGLSGSVRARVVAFLVTCSNDSKAEPLCERAAQPPFPEIGHGEPLFLWVGH